MERIIKSLRWLEVDRAIVYVILAKAWLALAGPITLVMISWYLSSETQGYYYTFTNLIALQVFLELGFYLVVTQFASHEWANLNISENGLIIGNPKSLSRLISLGRLIFKWYMGATTLFILIVGSGGYYFFALKQSPEIVWQLPWIVYVIIAGLQLWLLPFLALLEGCNQVANVQLCRLLQSVFSSIFVWPVLYFGGDLWIAVVSTGIGLAVNLIFILKKYGRFFKPFFNVSLSSKIDWREEIWPMQWRLAIGGLFNYFMFSLYTPLMFHYHGAVVAGQIGMTLHIIATLGSLTIAWITNKVPLWGMLIAKKNFLELDRAFFHTSKVAMGVLVFGSVILWLIIYLLNQAEYPLAFRLLPLLPTALFLLAEIILQVSQCLSAYLRAHKREPLMVVNIVAGLSNAFLAWILGSQYGPIGIGVSYILVVSLLVPFQIKIWRRCRQEWH